MPDGRNLMSVAHEGYQGVPLDLTNREEEMRRLFSIWMNPRNENGTRDVTKGLRITDGIETKDSLKYLSPLAFRIVFVTAYAKPFFTFSSKTATGAYQISSDTSRVELSADGSVAARGRPIIQGSYGSQNVVKILAESAVLSYENEIPDVGVVGSSTGVIVGTTDDDYVIADGVKIPYFMGRLGTTVPSGMEDTFFIVGATASRNCEAFYDDGSTGDPIPVDEPFTQFLAGRIGDELTGFFEIRTSAYRRQVVADLMLTCKYVHGGFATLSVDVYIDSYSSAHEVRTGAVYGGASRIFNYSAGGSVTGDYILTTLGVHYLSISSGPTKDGQQLAVIYDSIYFSLPTSGNASNSFTMYEHIIETGNYYRAAKAAGFGEPYYGPTGSEWHYTNLMVLDPPDRNLVPEDYYFMNASSGSLPLQQRNDPNWTEGDYNAAGIYWGHVPDPNAPNGKAYPWNLGSNGNFRTGYSIESRIDAVIASSGVNGLINILADRAARTEAGVFGYSTYRGNSGGGSNLTTTFEHGPSNVITVTPGMDSVILNTPDCTVRVRCDSEGYITVEMATSYHQTVDDYNLKGVKVTWLSP